MRISINLTLKNIEGKILDVGGGEGVIGQLYGRQVIAIDNRQEELDETSGVFQKMLMDARKLDFEDNHFDAVTFFYSLMFMDKSTQQQAIAEAARVLRPGGTLYIWDSEISKAFPEAFVVNLDIDIDEKILHTTYGVINTFGGMLGYGFYVIFRPVTFWILDHLKTKN